jgi:hypothetical protein
MVKTVENPVWAEWLTALMAGESRRNVGVALPSNRFHCLLDELPLHLVPRHAMNARPLSGEERFFLNPNCLLCSDREVPDVFLNCRDQLSGFALQGTMAWVKSTDYGWLPFWLGPRLEAVVTSLLPGEPVRRDFSRRNLDLLVAARILLPSADTLLHQRDRMLEQAGEMFRAKGYVPLTGLIHPFHIAALRRYFRFLIRTGAIRLGDRQSPLRYVAYNEPVARFFHRQIANTLRAVAGEPLKPSYVYMASYLSSAELKKHTDREQCEFSITLCIDFSPEPELETPWPILLETPDGKVIVHQAIGDGLAYRGTHLPHYRNKLREGNTSTSLFLHYVAENFEGSLE